MWCWIAESEGVGESVFIMRRNQNCYQVRVKQTAILFPVNEYWRLGYVSVQNKVKFAQKWSRAGATNCQSVKLIVFPPGSKKHWYRNNNYKFNVCDLCLLICIIVLPFTGIIIIIVAYLHSSKSGCCRWNCFIAFLAGLSRFRMHRSTGGKFIISLSATISCS